MTEPAAGLASSQHDELAAPALNGPGAVPGGPIGRLLDRVALRVRPTAATIEATSHCQLRCPSCPTAARETDEVLGRGYLKPEMLARILDGAPGLRSIELSNWGEAMLNPKLVDVLKLAHERGVGITLRNGVNLNTVREEVLEALVTTGVREVTCSIDGASQESYAQYRRGGNFDQVIENIKKINALKAKHGSTLPLLRWQFVVFGHNQHEVEQARQLADELGMAITFKLSWDPDFSPVTDRELVRGLTGAADRQEAREDKSVRSFCRACTQLWRKPAVNWDGTIVGCAINYWGRFGQVSETEGFAEAINSEKLRYARRMLMGQADPRLDIPCTSCDFYKYRQENGYWIRRRDILLWGPLRDVLHRFGLTQTLRQLVVFRMPFLMKVPVIKKALLGGI